MDDVERVLVVAVAFEVAPGAGEVAFQARQLERVAEDLDLASLPAEVERCLLRRRRAAQERDHTTVGGALLDPLGEGGNLDDTPEVRVDHEPAFEQRRLQRGPLGAGLAEHAQLLSAGERWQSFLHRPELRALIGV